MRRSNSVAAAVATGLLRFARNDGGRSASSTRLPLFGAGGVAQGFGDQSGLLGGVALGKAGGGRGGGVAAGINRPLGLDVGLDEPALEARRDVGPIALVARLLLRPDQLLEVGHALEARQQRLAGEGVKLLDADDRDVAVARLVAGLDQLVSELAGAQDQPPHVLVGRGVRVREDAAEMALAGE